MKALLPFALLLVSTAVTPAALAQVATARVAEGQRPRKLPGIWRR